MRPERALGRLGGFASRQPAPADLAWPPAEGAAPGEGSWSDHARPLRVPRRDEAFRGGPAPWPACSPRTAPALPRLGDEAPTDSPGVAVPRNGRCDRTAVAEPGALRRPPTRRRERRGHGPGATVMQCAAGLPFDEALAIADSALRHLDVTRRELLERA